MTYFQAQAVERMATLFSIYDSGSISVENQIRIYRI